MVDLPLACPAAEPLNPPGHGPSVLCGVLKLSNRGAHINGWTEAGQVSPFKSGQRDPVTVSAFCAGSGEGNRCTYQQCRIWRAEKHRIEQGLPPGPDSLRSETAQRRPDGSAARERLAELGVTVR